MNHSDIRKHLKKGEQAVDVLESMGYKYVANDREHPHWVAPENPLNDIQKAIEALVETRVAKAREDDIYGPNWANVKQLAGKKFSVATAKIPAGMKLADYGSIHFQNRQFTAKEIRYHRSAEFTGYAVLFDFVLRPFHKPEVVWLPMSACVFQR
ncbi:hypothetical protein ALEA_26 [Pseudomonas phage ALEA]|nr:hypothetical protein ALEA_26 [Pseudomonas phage ALEA]UAV89429.1 hypothetical protein JOR_25 [Pseudomonas phage JOR]UAV89528.1 hypothetical protein M12_25 [Pseudomonas phage M1.2]UAV89800.1 hypothetical protein NOI_25 [Pseudomonas phage NOI]UAV90072.1 hypothetical protein SNK_26 [Pseudomonas phage SNK]UGL61077.1 hypothetical protein [Pseudomonas phage Eir4]WVH05458.1 hypothetical protein FOMCTCXJ_CDS_0034 [Pseudomonas phage Athelas]